MLDFNKLQEIISSNNSFLLTTHVNPDADAIGSEVAFYFLLKELGKKVKIINHSETPYNLAFLDTNSVIEKFEEEKHKNIFNEVDVLVALDFNKSDRMVSMRKNFIESKKTKICIDHHQDPESFVDNVFVSADYSATGEIIYDFIKSTGIVNLNLNIAVPVYAAIMTDTGSFRFERTSPKIHNIAAELLDIGVYPGEIYDKIYDQSKFSKIRLLGRALDSLKLYGKTEKIAYMVLTREDFKNTEAVESDTDGFVNFSLSIENVVVGLLFIELENGFKVSFRSKGNIPVNKLAAKFGGGGHTNAAGARNFNNNLSEKLPDILNKAEEYI
ncbi:MAG TPA: bifunctional oligoribonuclease/PAP phosphatase NrnA [Ignavibacteriaceae bacterium]|nr:bifunctional oligoribonuclease/PAP phosphatase NrnA [Ignavibacteriaceae bacterium]